MTGELLAGSLPHNASRLVSQWAALHSAELMENWNRAQSGQTLFNIIPSTHEPPSQNKTLG